jgi:predicted  nucleic acid-binding Zn-ribbon protein
MSNAIEVIDQEIDEISQMLKHHAYQLEVLRNIREKLDASTGKLAIDYVELREEEPKRVKMTDGQVVKYAKKIARKIRAEGGTKRKHLKALWKDGDITQREWSYLASKILPSRIGVTEYNEIFKGTKYASKAS